ncbi:MAG: hypothetical protein LBI05_09670 [Planctomycetaceae bacterium]|jgi:hypothetical protein|nr:hypothetical protein [Planctomycetaceae bacterium]
MKNWTDYSLWEQKEESMPKKRGCCFWGCLVPFVCFLVLYLLYVDFTPVGYPVGLDKHNVNDALDTARHIRRNIDERTIPWQAVQDVISDWIKEEGKDQLFVGAWKIEPPVGVAYYFFDFFGYFGTSDWEKTRLVIRPDYTFVLIDPPKDLDYLHGFRGTITGTWKVDLDPSLVIHFTHETDIGEGTRIRSQNLRTLRKNDTHYKYLRLLPFWDNEDFPPRTA